LARGTIDGTLPRRRDRPSTRYPGRTSDTLAGYSRRKRRATVNGLVHHDRRPRSPIPPADGAKHRNRRPCSRTGSTTPAIPSLEQRGFRSKLAEGLFFFARDRDRRAAGEGRGATSGNRRLHTAARRRWPTHCSVHLRPALRRAVRVRARRERTSRALLTAEQRTIAPVLPHRHLPPYAHSGRRGALWTRS